MRLFRLLFIITIFTSLALGSLLFPRQEIDERAYLRKMAPQIEFSEKQGSPPHYRSEKGYVAFNSYDIVPSIRGYGGPIKVLIILDPQGRVFDLEIIEHRETKNYVHYMLSRAYLDRFIGKSVNDPFEVDNDIDGISRATISVRALADTIRESSREIASQVLGMEVRGGARTSILDLRWLILLGLYAFTFTLYHLSKRSKRFLSYRDIALIAGILIIGVYLSTPFSLLHIYNLLLLRLSSSALWYTIVGCTILSMLIAGRFYCGWLCPFGAITEFIGRIHVKKWQVSRKTDLSLRGLKYLLLIPVSIIVLLSGHIDYGNFETYITLFSLHGTVLNWLIVILMLLISLKIYRFWCRYLCPVGAIGGLLSRKTTGYRSSSDCPMANPPNPDISECIRCNRCYKRQ